MEDFKSLPKMKAFREGGHAKREEYCMGGKAYKKEGGKIADDDMAQDKKLIKKAFKQHDEAEHDKEPTEIKLRKGGRAKKEQGTVNRYKTGGGVASEKSKPAGDKDALKKVKPTGDKKAEAPSKGAEKPNFFGSDVKKEKSKPAGDKDALKKVKPTGDKKADAPSKGALVKKFNAGGLSNPMMDSGASAAPTAFQSSNMQFGPNAPATPPATQANLLQDGGQPTAFRRGGKVKTC